jgi:predicted HD phosphohydrolase
MSSTRAVPIADVEALVELLESLRDVPSEGSGYSELDHGLQCAAELVVAAPRDLELQLAGLVHDVGHAFGDDESHGVIGGQAVRVVLGERVGRLVRAHVVAKRFLVTTDERYRARLSRASTVSLAAQGGELTADEVVAFQAHPERDAALVLRRADDAAKVPGRVVDGLDRWVPRLREHARGVATARRWQ